MAAKKKAKKPKPSPNFKSDKGGRPERMNDKMPMSGEMMKKFSDKKGMKKGKKAKKK